MKIQDQKISLFENALSQKSTELTINDYFEKIQSGYWQDEVIDYRATRDTEKKKKIKAVTVSGLFSGRSDKDLKEHSGILPIDIDYKDQSIDMLDIRRLLTEIPELFAIHYSLGGKGLVAYFRIKKDKHYESFEAITKMLINDYGVIPDMHCGNVGRLRFVSYDPDLHLNYGAGVWNFFEAKEKRVNEQQYSTHVFSANDIDFIIEQIKQRQVNIAPDYYSWLRIGFALAEKFGEGGRNYFHVISSFYGGKQKLSPDKQYDSCLRSDRSKSGGISIKSFFYYAKLAGCELTSKRTEKIKTIAKIRKKQEQNGEISNGKQSTIQFLEEFDGITGPDVDEILEQVWKMSAKEIKDDSTDSILTELESFLKANYKIRLNEVTKIIEINGTPINDLILNTIYIHAKKVVSDKIYKEMVSDLIHSDFSPSYNPIFDFFEKNKHIKTEGNIDKLASCITSEVTDPTFIRDFLEKWLISIIASAHGIYSILCLVLVGQEQGTGKTNFFRELLPDQLRNLFAQNKLDGNAADVAKLMCIKLLICDDEFGGKSKQDEKKFKELIACETFTVRNPYGRYFEDMRRLAVLCGTSNEEHIINDLTGNRRIIPIQTKYIDMNKYNEIDKTELFIEAYWKYRKDPRGWFLNKQDIERLNEVTADSNEVTPELELPLKYFGKIYKYAPDAVFVSSSEMRSVIERMSGIRLSQRKLSIALKTIGYEYESKRIDDVRLRGFYVKRLYIESSFTTQASIPEQEKKEDHEKLPF
jgi:predicted P-loop ATPase